MKITTPQKEALTQLFAGGIWKQAVPASTVSMGRHSIIVVRALLKRELIERVASGDERFLSSHSRIALTETGRQLCDSLGMSVHDATPTIEQRLELFEHEAQHPAFYQMNLESLISTALHWGRRHAAELLEGNADAIKIQGTGGDSDLRAVSLLRDQARQIRSMKTRKLNGKYVSERSS